jgi:hypothetical protein
VLRPWLSGQGLLLVLLVLLTAPTAAIAQIGTVAVERENFRAAPNGAILAEVMRGTELRIGEARDRWREATLEGWIWSASVRAEGRDGYDLTVTPGDGENLRATPNGRILARLRSGLPLDGVEATGNWIRVRRTAWIWEPSLNIAAAAAETSAPRAVSRPTAAAAPAAETAAPRAAAAATPAAEPSAGQRPTAPGRGVPDPAPAGARDFATAGSRGLVVLTQPAGDTLAGIRPGATVQVIAREGDWARVRVEGWTFTAGVTADGADAGVLSDVGRHQLAADPDRYRGRLIEWTLQFIALQQAERFRSDFLEGEPFLLAKGPDDDAGFVYVAVPPEHLEAVRGLAPLQRIRVLGRIRTARSTLTEAPVIDLLELTVRDAGPRR